ncbi:hypothetical protein DYQ86_24200 [Acidobacteria bacterium AB60]|nr:hypothetical protein DYQ86_24200 [Acidobacteria bacterium AB60]
MKLRIKGDSLRLRIAPSEVARLLQSGRIEETIHFGPAPDACLTYALETAPGQQASVTVRSRQHEITVLVPEELARRWAVAEDVGIYGEMPTAAGRLELAVEKDFACLDKSAADNQDTYPNPNLGVNC